MSELKTPEPLGMKQILIGILQGAGHHKDGTTKAQLCSWLHNNVGYEKSAIFKSKVEKLLKGGKAKGILTRGKNASRYKIVQPDCADYDSYRKIKLERITPKATAVTKAKKKSPKKSSAKTPPTKQVKKDSRIFTDDPFNCHDESHPDYDPLKCEPAITASFACGLCDKLVKRYDLVKALNKLPDGERFHEYCWIIKQLKEVEEYKQRYSEQKHKISPV
eukprot:136422_1